MLLHHNNAALILNLLCARTGVHRLPLVQFAQFLVEHNCLFFYLLGTAPPPRVEELQPLFISNNIYLGYCCCSCD